MNPDYIKRINKVLEHIEENLADDLSLEAVSQIAFYSPFHLHRLFKAITSETLNAYITRKRLERAALLLIHNRELNITGIAEHSGFGSNSSFTRAFTKLYGQSPSGFRMEHRNTFRKIDKAKSKKGQAGQVTGEYLRSINNLKNWMTMNAMTEIRQMPSMKVAYLTQIGVDGVERTFEQILHWARPKGLLERPQANVIRIFHDSFKVTDEDKVRMSIGITVDDSIKPEGPVSLMTAEGGKCIVARFEIGIPDFERSWNGLFIWMGEQGYKKADRNPFEIYHNDPRQHPEGKCIVDLCIPIQ